MADHISLKVKLDEDIRRFSVPKGITFAELHSLVSKHFVLAPENVQLKYIDDEEEVSCHLTHHVMAPTCSSPFHP
jgi:hypothetical protein